MRLKIVIFQRNTFTAHSYVFELAFFECPGPYFWKAVTYVFFARISLYELFVLDAFPVVASLPPKNSVCEPEQQNDFRDVKPFVLMLAHQIKG